MTSPLTNLGLSIPVIAAPMAGGATTPAMVIAAARAGGIGFLGAGYKTPESLRAEISAVRDASIPFGVNVFAPNPVPITVESYRRYAAAVQREADRFGLILPADPVDDDDAFGAKIDLLLSSPVPIVSFTFGLPEAGRRSGHCRRPARPSCRRSRRDRRPNWPRRQASTCSPSRPATPAGTPARSPPTARPSTSPSPN